ncbi:MAG: hypothetical protein WCK47_06905 [bacterium]
MTHNSPARRTRATLARILPFILAAAAAMTCQAAPVGMNITNGNEVRAELTTTSIVMGEPLYLKITIVNRASPLQKANFGARLYLTEGHDIAITVQSPGELPRRYTAAEQPGNYPSVEVDLRDGMSVYYLIPLIYDARSPNGFLFGKPGDYYISVKLSYSILREPVKNITEIPLTKIRVAAPEGKTAEAFTLVASPDAARAMQTLLCGSPDVFGKVTHLASDYPATPYAPLCALLSAIDYMERKTPDYEAAIRVFIENYLRKYPADIRTSDAIFNIVACYTKLKQMEIAREWFYYLMDHDPSYNLLRPENPTSRFFYFGDLEESGRRRWWHYEKPWNIPPPPADKQQGS